MKYPTITFRTDQWVIDELKKRSEKERRSLSNYINRLIIEHLDKKRVQVD